MIDFVFRLQFLEYYYGKSINPKRAYSTNFIDYIYLKLKQKVKKCDTQMLYEIIPGSRYRQKIKENRSVFRYWGIRGITGLQVRSLKDRKREEVEKRLID